MAAPSFLFINPWIYDFAAYNLWAAPLGLLYIASVLKRNGFGVHFVDCLDSENSEMMKCTDIKKPFQKHSGCGHFFKEEIAKPDCLKQIRRKYRRYGITPSVFDATVSALPAPCAVVVGSMMTYWYPGVFEAIRRVRVIYPDVPVYVGGIYATLCHNHAKKYSGADAIIRWASLPEMNRIIDALTGRNFSFPKKAVHLDDLPYPAYELLPSQHWLPILTSSGCPFRCTYCASFLLNRDFIQRNPLKVVDEIEFWVERFGTKHIVFYDDALLINAEKHFMQILKEILMRKLPVAFHVPNGLHVRYITQPIAELMKEANFETIRLGLETLNSSLQEETGNKVKNHEFLRTCTILKKAGFTAKQVGVYIMAGLPGQCSSDVEDSIELVKAEGFKPHIAEFSPIPGTALWEEATRFSSFPIAEEPLFQNNTLLPCQWEKFTIEDLEKLKKETREGFKYGDSNFL